jgi:hypothetical protein
VTGVKEMTLLPVESGAPMAKTDTRDLATQIVAMASDPHMDVGKLEKLMQMQRELAVVRAKSEFNSAMSDAQKQMRPIAADAVNPSTRSKYASYAALDGKLRPIYTDHGFGLSFNTADGARDGWIRVVCNVSHVGGFDKDYHVDMPADGKGAKGGDVMTLTHAVGAGLSYGMRYLLKMIFNVAVGEDDRDGNDPPKKPESPAPKGFDQWWLDITAVADNGLPALKAAWEASKPEYRAYVTKTNLAAWETLKVKAANLSKGGKA